MRTAGYWPAPQGQKISRFGKATRAGRRWPALDTLPPAQRARSLRDRRTASAAACQGCAQLTLRTAMYACVAAVGCCLIAIVAGCDQSSPPPASAPSTPAASTDKRFHIGMSQCNLGEPWRVEMNAQIKKAAEAHPNLSVAYKDAQNDTLKQRAHVEEFVSAKVDLIIISPKEAAPLTEPVARAMDAGIPVIVLDRAVLGDKYTCFIGADNKMIGRAAGKWIAKKLGGKGKVVELKGLTTSIPSHDRHSGFREGIAGSRIEIVFEADMKWLEPDARKEMESALSRISYINLVYGHNDPGAHGAYLAAQAAGREKEMLFVGIDALPHEGVMYVRQGVLAATFEYPTGGKEAIETVLKILRGEKVPRQITLGSRLITLENVEKGGEPIGG